VIAVFDGEGVAVADGGAVVMFVPQCAEDPLDHAIALWAPIPLVPIEINHGDGVARLSGVPGLSA
jgi:hypothetical protein